MLSGKKYFYGLGQSARTKGFSKDKAFEYFCINSAPDYARIYFDKGYRGLAL